MSSYQRASYSLLCSFPMGSILGVNDDIFASDKKRVIENLNFAKMELDKLPKDDIVYKEIVWLNCCNHYRIKSTHGL